MKEHSVDLKNKIKTLGREIKSIITIENTEYEEELFNVSLNYESNILKSIMKCIKFESSVKFQKGQRLIYKLGVKIDNDYEYLNYGQYIIYDREKNEESNTYIYTCYDKMLKSMVDYEKLDISYPITVKDFLVAICNKLNIDYKDTNFYNKNINILKEPYLGFDEEKNERYSLGYTYRDVLDEIAQAVGGNIIINQNNQLEVVYPIDTNDTIDEEFIKDVNVSFGDKFGPVNAVVLSRADGADNVYKDDGQSIIEHGLCEIKIKDNQIMNFNNRSDFLDGLADALFGLEYYICDYESTGILYYEPLDKYNVKIGNNTYNCIMFNDEIEINLGLNERINAEGIEQEETDYKKADKTDIKLNQTYIIADKANQKIESVVTQIGDRSSKSTTITQDIDTIASQVEHSVNFLDTVEGKGELETQLALPLQVNAIQIRGNINFDNYFYSNDYYCGDSYAKG